MVLTYGKNVGIGTTAPSYKLDVNGTTRIADTLTLDTVASGGDTSTVLALDGSGNVDYVDLSSYDSDGSDDLSYSLTAGYLPYANTTTSLANSPFFTDGTNIGIGTTAPSQLLDLSTGVDGGIQIDGVGADINPAIGFALDGTTTALVGIDDDSGDLFKIDYGSDYAFNGAADFSINSSGFLGLGTDATSTSFITGYEYTTTESVTTGYNFDFIYDPDQSSNQTLFGQDLTLTINSTEQGNELTASALRAEAHINVGGEATDVIAGEFIIDKDTSDTLTSATVIKSTLENAFGTTITNGYGLYTDLSNFGTITNYYGLYLDNVIDTTQTAAYGIYAVEGDWVLDADGTGSAGTTTDNRGGLFLGEGQDLELYHDGTDSYIMNNTGDLYIGDAGTDNVLLSANGGNVGIGTTSPSQELDIVGDALISGNIAIGGSSYDANRYFNLDLTGLSPSEQTYGIYSQVGIGSTIPSNGDLFASRFEAEANHASGAGTQDRVYAGYFNATNENTGTVDELAGMDIRAVNENTGTSNSTWTIWGQNGNGFSNSGGSVGTAYGILSQTLNGSGDTITTATNFHSKLLNNGTITDWYGFYLDDITNNDTITNTYGLYIGDITTGTQTNTPYSIYASDANTLNYFAGNVGIGTTSPSQELDIVGDALISGNIAIGGSSYDANRYSNLDLSSLTLSANTYGSYIDLTTTESGVNNLYGSLISLSSSDSTSVGSLFGQSSSINYDGTGTLAVGTAGANIALNNNTGTVSYLTGLYASTINDDGAVGEAANINSELSNGTGTITNAYGLQISGLSNSGTITNTYGVHVGDITAGTQTNTPYSFYASDSGALNYFAGNVGIGTTAPDQQLEVFGNAPKLRLSEDNNPSNYYLDIGLNFSAADTVNFTYRTYDFLQYDLTDQVTTVGSNLGKVNIELGSNPGDDFAIEDTLFVVESDTGNVGIGTTDPGGLLELTSSTENDLLILNGTNNQDVNLRFQDSGADEWQITRVDSLNTLNIVESGVATRMTFEAGGNIGIGTTAPGSLLDLYSTSTSTSFTGFNLDWQPSSSTTLTGDLFNINLGANGSASSLFNITDNGSSLFKVTETQIINALPTAFTASGDVSFANDLQFTNQTAATIKSDGPLTIESGEAHENLDLTLKPSGSGSVVVDDGSNLELYAEQKLILDADDSGDTYLAFDNTNNWMEFWVDGGNTSPAGVEILRIKDDGDVDADGTVSSTAFDFAETYPTADSSISAGDVVMIASDSGDSSYLVEKTSGADAPVLGIVSADPGFVLGGSTFRDDFCAAITSEDEQIRNAVIAKEINKLLNDLITQDSSQEFIDQVNELIANTNVEEKIEQALDEDLLSDQQIASVTDKVETCNAVAEVPVALSGRVPVKVDSTNGDIKAGDLLAASTYQSGKAMKATAKGWVIGRALQDADSDTDTVMVFVNLSYYTGDMIAESVNDIFAQTDNIDVPTTLEEALTISADENGRTEIALFGNFNVTGEVVSTTMTALSEIRAGFIKIDAEDNSITTTDGSDLKLQTNAIAGNVDFFNGELIVTSDGGLIAQGDIEANKVTAKQFAVLGEQTIAEQNVVETEEANSETNESEEESTTTEPALSTVGEGVIEAASKSVTIYNVNTAENSKIFVTATTSTGGSSLIVTNKSQGEFTVEIEEVTADDVKFDYWIVAVE